MTDQTAPDTTNHDRRLAHSWAETVKANPDAWGQRQLAAARVILHDLPDPPRPTLADMLPKERAACQWMQADVGVERRIIVRVMDVEEGAVTLVESGDTVVCPHSSVTPRPDLPSMEWPGDQKPAPALPNGWRLADHQRYGRVIVTNTTPNRDGRVYYVRSKDRRPAGFSWECCDPTELTFLDAEPEADQ